MSKDTQAFRHCVSLISFPPTSQWHSLATYGPPPAWCHLPCGWLFWSPLMAASSPYSQRQGFSLCLLPAPCGPVPGLLLGLQR